MRALLLAFGIVLAVAASGCGDSDDAAVDDAAVPKPVSVEEDVLFRVGSNELRGVLTLPASDGPHPAVVITSGSETQSGALQSGVSDAVFVDLANRLADAGFAALRYDTAGVGESEGDAVSGTIQSRRDEAVAALRRIQQHPTILADEVGLWGSSQEAWTIAMAAADHPDDVAFIIPVSGAGISVAEQQVWGIETQSRAAGLGDDDVARATLVGGLLVDWPLSEPSFHTRNLQLVEQLGAGPWQDFFDLVYESPDVSDAESLRRATEILTSIDAKPWAQELFLEELYLPTLRSLEPEQLELARAMAEQSLLVDPREHLTRVRSPVLAFFGEDDIVQPTDRSALLYADYLSEAGNDDVTIVRLPGVGHDIVVTTPGYWDQLEPWLLERSSVDR